MPTGLSALVLPVPEADPLVSAWRARFDKHAAQGVPAHVTLMAPWVSPDRIAAELPALRDLCAGPAPRFSLGPVVAWPGLAVLEPSPDGWFHRVGGAIMERWDLLPYGGKHGTTLQPHLTVAYGDEDPAVEAARFAEIAADLDPKLPLDVVGREVAVMVKEETADGVGRWHSVARVALGAA